MISFRMPQSANNYTIPRAFIVELGPSVVRWDQILCEWKEMHVLEDVSTGEALGTHALLFYPKIALTTPVTRTTLSHLTQALPYSGTAQEMIKGIAPVLAS